jgi:hypothetical protein
MTAIQFCHWVCDQRGPATPDQAPVAAPKVEYQIPHRPPLPWPTYRAKRTTSLGTGQHATVVRKGYVWDRFKEREKLLPYMTGNPTEARIQKILRIVSPEPTPPSP